MAVYVISDIHGMYDKLIDMLEFIKLSEDDTLYVLGDMVDRGPHPIKVILKLMEMKNVKTLIGNHDNILIGTLKYLADHELDKGENALEKEFQTLSLQEKMKVIDFLTGLPLYFDITVNNRQYILVHGGLGNFAKDKPMEKYSIDELVWTRPDFSKPYYDDKIVVCGHTPTQNIRESDCPGYIMKKNNFIAIDCGASYPKGHLAAICLDTGEEFYV